MPESLCESCHSGCCRSFAIPLTGADVLRIENRLGLDFWQFACRWADPSGIISRNQAPQFRFEDEPETPFVICLMHKESAFLKGSTGCRFLMECEPDLDHPIGTARCGIYDSRPGACRGFPAKLCGDDDLVVLSDIAGLERRGPDPAYQLCPRPWTPEDIDQVQMIGDLVAERHEMAFFRRIAEVWNRSPQPWDIFPEFLRNVYARRITVEQPSAASEDIATVPFPQLPAAQSRAA